MSTTRPSALAAGILSMLLVATVAAPTFAADPEPIYRFTGYGTDHGVGLSQRGAAGRAADGQDYDQILAHYFRNTRLATVPTDTTIRALVVKSYKAGSDKTTLVQGGMLSPTQKSRWTFDTPGVDGRDFPQSWKLVLIGRGTSGAWNLKVQNASGQTQLSVTDTDARFTVRSIPTENIRGRLRLNIRPSTKYDTYEGVLRFGRVDGRIRVVNIVPIEPFVRSVAPQELGPSNDIKTLRAQSVVARSYFLAGLSTNSSWLSYDVESYRDSQSYKGAKGEKAKNTQATDDTAYEVVAFKGTAPSGTRRVSVLIEGDPDPAYYVARTFYHAVGGGATEASHNVFTGSTGKPGSKTPYLKGGPDLDEDGVPYDANASAYSWRTRTFTLDQLSAILAKDSRTNVGKLSSWPFGSEATYREQRAASLLAGDTTPSPTYRGVSGRLTWVVLKGVKNGNPVEKKVAGWLFKSVFNTHRGSGDKIGSTMVFRTKVD